MRGRDFSWQGRRPNPYARRSTDWKFRLKISLLSALLFSFAALVIYHPRFQVSTVELSGLKRAKEEEMRPIVTGIIRHKAWFIFPGESYLFVDLAEIEDILTDRFPVRSVSVTKHFPDKISIAVEEKLPAMIFDNGQHYSYLDAEGKLIETVRAVADYEWKITTRTVTSTASDGRETSQEEVVERSHRPDAKLIASELGSWPLVYDAQGKDLAVNGPVLDPQLVSYIADWQAFLTRSTDILPSYFIMDSEFSDIIIKTVEGWEIKARRRPEGRGEFNELLTALRDTIDRRNLSYIDVRYQGRVYWQ
ncbi:MAG: hypothetical protein UY92_C0006G0084 [Candidatus Magasanikbacteria bacterium GW2011_GWA2_56_11]|uniref:POTRA domain-containing protein n=1 Tax=Candidatus Magasanikbacteria bacterium GW2011_GWA2_56_11 TaxID=1619044 RepID=A0A0G1YGF6_9BACT|nr:MAG: hypothetical protein UY92_C0006G0084 [Candidatus Magasanikbacteria bacterium GW2011_GWA2_56_11]